MPPNLLPLNNKNINAFIYEYLLRDGENTKEVAYFPHILY